MITIYPCFYTITMLFIIFPTTFIFWSICMWIYTITICFIIFPFTIIYIVKYNTYITIYMIKYTSSISFIIFPISFIFSTIWPDLYTISITIYTNPNIYIILYHSPVYVAPFSYVCVVLLSLTVSVSRVVGNIISTLFGLLESFDY